MQDDSEVLQRKLLKVLQDLIPAASPTDVEAVSRSLGEGGVHPPNDALPQGTSAVSSPHGSENLPLERESLFELGEIPAVQDRFYALLKHRLQTEIQRTPPLFPWETEVHDYEAENAPYGVPGSGETPGVGVAAGEQKVPVGLWITQLKNFNLPVAIPETVLGQLLQRCQEIAHSSLLEGAKLVRAVEDLFPGHTQDLNQIAGLVMTSPARSGAATSTPSGTNYPASYEAAVPAQQMVLSLLAAREIITSLTLTVSASQPIVERQWLTESGVLTLKAEYEPQPNSSTQLRIQGSLPSGGSLVLRGDGSQASAMRSTPGSLSVELFDLHPSQLHVLEVRLTEEEPNPLIFTIRIVEGLN
ncbi:MAG: hypothetical protein WCA35_06445 [Kovacikia sp.]